MLDVAPSVLKIRRLFGALASGALLLGLLAGQVELGRALNDAGATAGPHGRFLIPGLALIVCLFVGGMATNLAMGLLSLLSEGVDALALRLERQPWVKRISRRLETVSLHDAKLVLQDYAEQTRRLAGPSDQFGRFGWVAYKLRVLERSPRLGDQLLDLEGDINFHAGMLLPAVTAAILSARVSLLSSVLAWLVVLYIVLRFNRLRHQEALKLAAACLVLDHERRSDAVEGESSAQEEIPQPRPRRGGPY